jgi:hypothetical protein
MAGAIGAGSPEDVGQSTFAATTDSLQHTMGEDRPESGGYAFPAFDDHHPYSDGEATELLALSQRHDAVLVTTEKDMMRLEGGAGAVRRRWTRPTRSCRTIDSPAGPRGSSWRAIRRSVASSAASPNMFT